MEMFEYQNRLLQEDGLAAKDNCEKVLSEIATKYKMSDADYENLQKAIFGDDVDGYDEQGIILRYIHFCLCL